MKPAAPIPHLTHPAVLRRPRSRLGRWLESLAAAVTLPATLLGAFALLLASRMTMAVGVKVTTTARAGSGDAIIAPGSRYFAVVLAEKGDTATPQVIRSMDAYVREFGNRVSYGFGSDDIQSYFDRGGTQAVVTRVVGASATKGTAQLVDRAGSPLSTILLTAISAGAWSANLTRQVAAGVGSNTFTLTLVYKSGTVDEITEIYKDLTDPADAVAKINGRSRLVVATNSGSATAAPNNNPAIGGPTAFSTGTDDRASVDTAALIAALDRFTPAYGPGAVAIPGYDLSIVATGLKAHCKANGERIGLTHDVLADSIAGMKTLAATVYGAADSEWLALFGPWIKVSDGAGGSRTIPPTGAVAGLRAAAMQMSGAWRWPIGEAGSLPNVIGTELDIDLTNAASMIDAGVNPIRSLVGRGIELYGWRSLSNVPAYYSIAARDTLNQLSYGARQLLEDYYGDPIDSNGQTIAGVKSELDGMCRDMLEAGGLYAWIDPTTGNRIDDGYSVSVVGDPAHRTITATLAVRITEAAELILVNITKVAPDQAV